MSHNSYYLCTFNLLCVNIYRLDKALYEGSNLCHISCWLESSNYVSFSIYNELSEVPLDVSVVSEIRIAHCNKLFKLLSVWEVSETLKALLALEECVKRKLILTVYI